GILIYLTQHKSLAIRALVVEDPGAVDVGGDVDKQGAAFAAGNVSSLVEALGGKPAPASQGFAAPPTQQAVGIVFDDSDIGPVGQNFADTGDIARNAGVMHWHNGAHRIVQQLGKMARVKTERARLDIAKQQLGSLTCERKRRGSE